MFVIIIALLQKKRNNILPTFKIFFSVFSRFFPRRPTLYKKTPFSPKIPRFPPHAKSRRKGKKARKKYLTYSTKKRIMYRIRKFFEENFSI